jgi:hypothetical protein
MTKLCIKGPIDAALQELKATTAIPFWHASEGVEHDVRKRPLRTILSLGELGSAIPKPSNSRRYLREIRTRPSIGTVRGWGEWIALKQCPSC